MESIGPEHAIELNLQFKEDQSFLTDLMLEDFGSKMKNLEKLQIFISEVFQGSFEFTFPLLSGIQSSCCKELEKLKFVFVDPQFPRDDFNFETL